jgi:hypothetical protein
VINNHDAIATGTSPFFIMHGYHVDLIDVKEDLRTVDPRMPKEKGEVIVRKLASVVD